MDALRAEVTGGYDAFIRNDLELATTSLSRALTTMRSNPALLAQDQTMRSLHQRALIGLCERDSGACVAEADVLYVTTDGTGATCTRAIPCGSIQTAIETSGGARIWILVASGTYNEALQIAGKTVRIIADGADLRSIAAVDQPGLEVTARADVTVDGLVIRDASGVGGDGILCNATGGPSTVRLRGVRLENNDDQGLDADGCTVEITQSTVSGNAGGGLSLQNTAFAVTNNFIVRNGQAGGLRGGVSIESTMAGDLAHNTIVDNVVADGQVGGVECDGTHSLRNNIVFGNDGVQTGGTGCSHTYSLIGPQGEAGEGNIDDPPAFVSATDGDFHLGARSAGVDVAMASGVTVDHDGDVRPAGRGPDMGADETTGARRSADRTDPPGATRQRTARAWR